MKTVIIIDDEMKGRMALRQKLQDYCTDVHLLAEADNGEDGIRIIEKYQPDIVFLDIEMPRMNGFDMLQKLKQKNFNLIFTTAYDQYAIKAIKFAAFDYLLKPIDIEELQLAVEKSNTQNSNTEKKLEVLDQNLHGNAGLNKIAIPTLEGLLFFSIGDIIHLEANRNYTTIYFTNAPKLIASKTLKDFEEILPTNIFFRTHHSHLINLNYIKRYIKGDGGQIEMQNGIYVDVSRRKKNDFLNAVGLN
ncbi:MAG: LytTR family DNA-binding domain-containing protein [Ferruginibacter sp.]